MTGDGLADGSTSPQATWSEGLIREQVARVLRDAGRDPSGIVPIVQAGHPALRMCSVRLDGQLDHAALAELVAVMHRTMTAAPGVGLAAPQIGLPIALAVLADPGVDDSEIATVRERPSLPFRVLVNPQYQEVSETTDTPSTRPQRVGFYEGCLSVTGYQAVVVRPRRIRLIGQDEHGASLDEVLHGWPARIVQHETDHLNGTLYLDRAIIRSLSTVDEIGAHWASPACPDEAARMLGFGPIR